MHLINTIAILHIATPAIPPAIKTEPIGILSLFFGLSSL